MRAAQVILINWPEGPLAPWGGSGNRRAEMKGLDIITLILVIIGAINWGLVGLFGFNQVGAIYGDASVLTRIIYILVGLSGLWQLMPLFRSFGNSSM
jgi:uncharacterized membrane protein YuzA (DUF378 family)